VAEVAVADNRQRGQHGPNRERTADRGGARVGRDAVLRLGTGRQRVVGSQLKRDLLGQVGGRAARHG